MRLTAGQLYERLLEKDKILTQQGRIKFCFGGVEITVRQKDVVGNIVQEWLRGWLDKNGIDYALNDNSQMPPDFYLDPADKSHNLLEVKAFNRAAAPGFDIADFKAYAREIIGKPYMLHADYLVFGYDMDAEGVVTVKDLWLKKVWEITRSMENWPLNLQVKQGVVHKIRPGAWYSTGSVRFPPFERLEDFLSAVEETVYQNPDTRKEAGQWKNRFLKSYCGHYGTELEIPRWGEIKGKYRKGK